MTRIQHLLTSYGLRIGAALLLAAVPASAQLSNPVKLLKGVILDARSGKPANGGRIFAYQGNGATPVTNSRINPGTGSYQMILNPSTEYRIRIEAISCYYTDFTITTPPGSNYEEIVKEFRVQPVPIGETVFQGRLFSPGSAELGRTAELQQLLDFMKTQRYVTITLELTPDLMLAPPPQAKKAAAKPAAKKKGKKGAAEPAPPPPAAAQPTGPSTSEQLAKIGADRKTAINSLLKQEKISLTRVQWVMRDGVALPPGLKALPDNVAVKVRGIEIEDDD